MTKFVNLLAATAVLFGSCAIAGEADVDGGERYETVNACTAAIVRHDLLNVPDKGVLVAAHRGFHRDVPENSIASIEAAIAAGIDIVELDVRVTKDGMLVLMHDETVDRTTTGVGKISAMPFDEVRALRLLDNEGEATNSEVPTLEDALQAARGRIFVNIDLKVDDAAPVLREVIRLQMLDNVMFFTSDENVRARMVEAVPSALVMPLAREARDVRRLMRSGVKPLIHLREEYNTPEIAVTLDTANIASWTNALGEVDAIASTEGAAAAFAPIVSNRPDVIQTDRPKLLLDYLVEQKLHWSSWATVRCD